MYIIYIYIYIYICIYVRMYNCISKSNYLYNLYLYFYHHTCLSICISSFRHLQYTIYYLCRYRYSNYRYLSELQEPHTCRNVTPCKKKHMNRMSFLWTHNPGEAKQKILGNGSMRSSPVMAHLYVWRTGELRDSRLDWAKCQRFARKTYCLLIVGSGRNRWR